MFTSRRYLLLAVLVLGLVAMHAHAQNAPSNRQAYPRVNLNPQIAPGVYLQQAAYNTAVMGRAYSQIPPYALGYNPYQGGYAGMPGGGYGGGYAAGPALAAAQIAASPYALSTAGGYNPYMGTAGAGSTGSSPYSLSTVGSSPYNTPGAYGSAYNNYPAYGIQDPVGAALQGAAAYTTAAGVYHKTIQEARLTREQARQASFETTRRRIELERWIESTRPTYQQIRDNQAAAELALARKESPEVDISSGKALNVLLQNIQRSSQLNLGPNVALDDDILKNINLAGAGSIGNVGMLKDVGNLTWPEALRESSYDEARRRLNKNLISAVTDLKDNAPVAEGTLKDIRADFKTINDKLADSADELNPAQYIESRRFLTQLNQAIRALGDKNVAKHFNKAWTAKGKNVAELVAHLTKEGLNFAPAAPGDQSAYKALYIAMRQFDNGLATAQAQK